MDQMELDRIINDVRVFYRTRLVVAQVWRLLC